MQILNAWERLLAGFGSDKNAEGKNDKKRAWSEKEFSLPIEDQLSSGGMMSMLFSAAYQACRDNFPRDSWVRTLMHACVLMVSGYGQHPSVVEELRLIYNSEQIGPIGYALTAKLLQQLGHPVWTAFARRGLQAMSVDDFRKDWKPLVMKNSKIKDRISSVFEQFQTCSDDDIRLSVSIFPEELKNLMEAAAYKLKQTESGRLYETLDPILANFWETIFKEQVRKLLNELLDSQK